MKRRTAKGAASTFAPPAPSGICGGNQKKAAKFERRLLKYEELPEYLKDNEFIRDYYRCEWPLKDAALSLFCLHNETLNIWTHLIGFLIFLGLTVMSLTEKTTFEHGIAIFLGEGKDGWLKTKMMNQSNGCSAFFQDSYSGTTIPLPMWPWLVFLTGSMCCLVTSAVSHLLSCHSIGLCYLLWRLDYAGISLMIVSSFFAPVYYVFYDHPVCLLLYLSSIAILGVLATATLLAPALSTAQFRPLRAALFLCMGFSGVVPAAHAALLHWGTHPHVRASLAYEALMGVLYGLGAAFYVARVPERWRPGAFDVVGHSHQIFHVFVVAAALVHCAATLTIMEWRRGLLGA
ncbi:Heptahelical transmembrane protein 3 [Striga hermonthica]|uniref:Heptahelical transmembrane protein 3 n=1 Tax=Striga hermonthica TaxID=68872 RepID=A0A9N7RSW6_STRHE|nr:Heptahelical transmembrane protein 3 [Striga hermonthica]